MYEYTPLAGPRSIRVLELQPAWKKSTADLTVRLLEVSIDKPPNFEALSYAWESQKLDQSILCGGETLLISATCKAALLRLRRKRRNRLLWIDQICINQISVKEKNLQVAIMGEIYGRAETTLVWLGVNPKSNKLLRGGQELRVFYACRLFKSRRLNQWYRGMTAERSLSNLNSISWFNRIWTIQEVAIARQVTILSSKREVDYDQFMDDWMNMHGSWFHWENKNLLVENISARYNIREQLKRNRLEERKKTWEEQEPMTFLCSATALASSHASDKIFALHGVMTGLGAVLPEPEYTMDTGGVYWKACSELMTQTRSLQPLMLVNGLHWNSDLPSWVPDFNQTHRRIVAPKLLCKDIFGRDIVEDYIVVPDYVRENSLPKFELIGNHKIIATKTKIIGLIRGRIYQQTECQSNRFGDGPLDVARLVREHIHAIHCFQSWILASETLEDFTLEHGFPLEYGEESKDLAAIAELMFKVDTVFGIGFRIGVQERQKRIILIRLLRTAASNPRAINSLFCRSMQDNRVKEKFLNTPDFANLLHFPEVQLLAVIEWMKMTDCFEMMKALAHGNAFFWVKDRHIGTAPHAVAVGDVVAFIPGIKVPMILRPTQPDTYQVIGPAHVTGMMRGEQWKRREDGDLEKEFEDNNICDIFLV